MVPWAQPSPQRKRHLDRFSRFAELNSVTDRQTNVYDCLVPFDDKSMETSLKSLDMPKLLIIITPHRAVHTTTYVVLCVLRHKFAP